MNPVVKKILTATVFRTGSIRTVLFGPCRGLKYRIFPGFGHAYLYGGWEQKETGYMMQMLAPGMVAYDLGANYGMHTLLFARLVGPSGKVYSFEPVPGIFKSLGEQVALNHFQNTVLVPKAVAEREGAMRFDLGHHEGAGHLASDGGVEVEITTLDHFVEEGNLPPGFIKIDIEGAESKALLGARKVIEKFRPNMMIELHNPGEDTAVGQFLMDLNYVAFRSEDGSQIRDMHKCWPDPTGIWGKIIALPTERQSIFRKL